MTPEIAALAGSLAKHPQFDALIEEIARRRYFGGCYVPADPHHAALACGSTLAQNELPRIIKDIAAGTTEEDSRARQQKEQDSLLLINPGALRFKK